MNLKLLTNIQFKTIIVDDNSKDENLSKIKKIVDTSNLDINITTLNYDKYKDMGNQQDT